MFTQSFSFVSSFGKQTLFYRDTLHNYNFRIKADVKVDAADGAADACQRKSNRAVLFHIVCNVNGPICFIKHAPDSFRISFPIRAELLSLSIPSSSTILFFFLNSVLRPFQDYFSSYETGQSVGFFFD